jgi:hypothetical protein
LQKGTSFEICRCDTCGSKGAHLRCGKILKQAPFFVCSDHDGADLEMDEHKRLAIQRLREENVYISDDDDDDDEELFTKVCS